MNDQVMGFEYLKKLWWESTTSRRFLLVFVVVSLTLPALERWYRTPTYGGRGPIPGPDSMVLGGGIVPDWFWHYFLYPLISTTWAGHLLELILLWFACASVERYFERGHLWLRLLLGVPLLRLLVALLSQLLPLHGRIHGPGLIGMIALGLLSATRPDLSFNIGGKRSTIRRGQVVLVCTFALFSVLAESMGNALAALMTIPLGFPLSGRLDAITTLFARRSLLARGPNVAQRAEPVEPKSREPLAHSTSPPRVLLETGGMPGSGAALWNVVVLDFDRLLVGSPSELLVEHFGMTDDEVLALLMTMPFAVVRAAGLAEAQAIGEKLTRLGANVELRPSLETKPDLKPALPERGEDGGSAPCYWCAEPTANSARLCGRCGRSLMFDAFLTGLSREPRVRYGQIKSLSDQLFQGRFGAARDLADHPERPIWREITRADAASKLPALERIGLGFELRPNAPARPAALGRLSQPRWLAVAAGVLGLATTGFFLMRRHEPPPALALDLISDTHQEASQKVASLACSESIGTGFFVEPDLLLTNAHVVCSGPEIDVTLSTGRVLTGRVEKRDHSVDLATVRVDEENPAFTLGDATKLKQGSAISLIGNPHGLGFSLSQGIIAHARRRLGGVWVLQLNASVNPGNSGGPVLNAEGHVVGIVTIKARAMEGVAFAVPINYAYVEDSPSSLLLDAPDGATDASFRQAFRSAESIDR